MEDDYFRHHASEANKRLRRINVFFHLRVSRHFAFCGPHLRDIILGLLATCRSPWSHCFCGPTVVWQQEHDGRSSCFPFELISSLNGSKATSLCVCVCVNMTENKKTDRSVLHWFNRRGWKTDRFKETSSLFSVPAIHSTLFHLYFIANSMIPQEVPRWQVLSGEGSQSLRQKLWNDAKRRFSLENSRRECETTQRRCLLSVNRIGPRIWIDFCVNQKRSDSFIMSLPALCHTNKTASYP